MDETGWISVRDRLPDASKWTVQVVKQCAGREDKWQGYGLAMLIYIGGDRTRPLWVEPNEPSKPVENVSWFVTHWRPLDPLPEPEEIDNG